MNRIVVGIDGSEYAARALVRAVEEARLRRAKLDVVYVIPHPSMIADPVLAPPPPVATLRKAGAELVENALARVATDGLDVSRTIEVGHPTQVLCDVAAGADLLVVGSRGYGGFRGLLAGSVTHQLVAHAPCALLVVVPESRERRVGE